MTTTMAFEVLNYPVPSFLFLLMEEAINTMFIFSIKVLLPIKKRKKVEEAINWGNLINEEQVEVLRFKLAIFALINELEELFSPLSS